MVKNYNYKTNHSFKRGNKSQSWGEKRQTSLRHKDVAKSKKWFYLLPLGLVLLLMVIEIYLANRLSTQGKVLQNIEQNINLVEEENHLLKSETASMAGLSKLTLLASKKGYVKNPPVVNLSTKVPFALKAQ